LRATVSHGVGPSKTGRRAPRSGPQPRPRELPPCRCGNFRRVREVPRRPPGTSFGLESLQKVAGAERRQGWSSVRVERNNWPCRRPHETDPKSAAGHQGAVPGRGRRGRRGRRGSRRADAATSDECGRSHGGLRAPRSDLSHPRKFKVRRAAGVRGPSTLRQTTGLAGYRNRPKTRRWAPMSGPRPRRQRLPPCRCDHFRHAREVPRWSPATSFSKWSPRSVSNTEIPQDGLSALLERNDRPVGGVSELPSQPSAMLRKTRSGQGHPIQFPPSACGEGRGRGDRRERKCCDFAVVKSVSPPHACPGIPKCRSRHTLWQGHRRHPGHVPALSDLPAGVMPCTYAQYINTVV